MTERGASRGDLRRAAEILEARSEEIVAAYEMRLLEEGSPLISCATTREQLKSQARSILGEVAGSLRGERVEARDEREVNGLSASIGATRASEGVHASESLRAVAVLSEAALSAVVEELPPSGTSRSGGATVALGIQESIMERVAESSVSYVGYLLRKVHESHADERRRIGRELHDRVAHSIVVVFRNLELYEMYRGRDPSRAREKLELAKSTAQEALKSARGLSSELRNSPLAEEGLEVALSDYLRLVVPPDVEARLLSEGDESLLTPEIRDELFLIAREAIRNAVTHSGAGRITVEVSADRHQVRTTVEDDGRGLDQHGDPCGTGLSSMAERAALLGGRLSLESLPGSGTRVEVAVPLPRVRPVP
jgi:signal transduction histidine kinase